MVCVIKKKHFDNCIFIDYLEESIIQELPDLGQILKDSAPVDLSTSEADFVVKCIKHILLILLCFK
jgi:hypothetical protein